MIDEAELRQVLQCIREPVDPERPVDQLLTEYSERPSALHRTCDEAREPDIVAEWSLGRRGGVKR